MNIHHIQNLFLLFEQNNKLTLLEYPDYTILLEPVDDADCWDYAYNALLSIRVKHEKDMTYTLNKIADYAYRHIQVSYFDSKLQISCLLDRKIINADILIKHIHSMLKII
jgi:hypothetical protein